MYRLAVSDFELYDTFVIQRAADCRKWWPGFKSAHQ